jgi:hypothetical protein
MVIMEQILQGGTDAASMVVFDPAALPDDFDAKQKVDPISQLEELQQAGRVYWIEMHADGGYELGVYAGGWLPDDLQPYAKALDTFDRFQVPSGRLFFTGIEYAFKSEDSFLRKYPHMGEAAELEAGEYRAEFFEFEYPEDFHEGLLRQKLPVSQFRVHRLMNTLAPIGCVLFLALLAALAILKWRIWLVTVLPWGLALMALPLILSRLPAYRKADRVYKDIQMYYPGYGVVLQTVGRA